MYRLLALPLLLACGTDVKVGTVSIDADHDGYDQTVDCDDGRNDVNPTAPERCDGRDNDCDDAIDEDPTDGSTWYGDGDGDGYGDPGAAETACDQPEGTSADATDCDDTDALDHPGGTETCNSDDEDCDGENDEDAVDQATVYADMDGDGYGDPDASVTACEVPESYVADHTDCDDTDPDIHPNADESDCTDPTDYNCDGSVAYADADADGWVACEECDDSSAARNPGNPEICDGAVDEDCDSLVDDDDPSLTDPSTWYADADADGWGDAGVSTAACVAPEGTVADPGDCDDADAARAPDLAEICDPADTDEDCDSVSDDADPSATGQSTWYADADGDGHGGDSATAACDAPTGTVSNTTDCDDGDAAISPDAAEICDDADTDEDCDGLVDDDDPSATGLSTWITDSDGDGYGGGTARACASPANAVSLDGDCDDDDATISPEGSETCEDGVDQDCDGLDPRCALEGDHGEADAYARIFGTKASGGFPDQVLGIGDQDGDGADDLLILWDGASDTASYQGAAYLFRGPLSGDYTTSDADATVYGEKLGYRVQRGARVGDLDGDGLDDVLVGSYLANPGGYASEGAAWVLLGPLSGTATTAAADGEITGGVGSRYSGRYLQGLGDLDGDGLDDLGVGSGSASTAATDALGIFYGPATGKRLVTAGDILLQGESSTDGIGAMAGQTDLDGDGVGDLLVGAMYNASGGTAAGAAYLLIGPLSSGDLGSLYTRRWSGDASNDVLGAEVSAPGDLDGDGHEDMVVVGYQDGEVHVIYGDASAPASGDISDAASATITLDYHHTEFLSQAPAGDVDDDGDTELYVSDWHDDTAASEAGLVGLFDAPLGALAPGDAEVTFSGDGVDDLVGRGADALDMNGDGYPDAAIGAYGDDVAGADAGAVWLFAP